MTDKSWTTYFISDTHFGHKNIINYCDRPFHDEFYMKEELIKNINNVVKEKDLLIWGGDIFFFHTKEEMLETMNRINCKRNILIRGNHDFKPRIMMNAGFDLCVDEMVMVIAGEKVTISHYPFKMPEWKYQFLVKKNKFLKKITGKNRQIYPQKYHYKRPIDKGQFLIHGHTHNKIRCKGRRIHIGVDAWHYKPINIQKISNLIYKIKKAEKNGKKLIINHLGQEI